MYHHIRHHFETFPWQAVDVINLPFAYQSHAISYGQPCQQYFESKVTLILSAIAKKANLNIAEASRSYAIEDCDATLARKVCPANH